MSLTLNAVYASFRPEFEKQRAERLGEFQRQHQDDGNDKVISQAILHDLKAAKKQVTDTGGFGWGIRQALFGRPDPNTPKEDASSSSDKTTSSHKESG